MGDEAASSSDAERGFERLIAIGIALSSERDHNRLMERILLEAKDLSNADGGTLYLLDDDGHLHFEIMRTDSLNIALGGTTGREIAFEPLPLRDPESGEENHNNVATHVALTGKTINIADAYKTAAFDFSGTKSFDEGTGYRSKSFLTVPLKNHDSDVIGVLQLLNARDWGTGEVVPFGVAIQPLIESLASQAAIALDNQQLIAAQRTLLDSFIELIASAIDAKSPYTGTHCQRVPALTEMLTRAACESDDPAFAGFDLTQDEWYALHIASWLHDCGKITTPEYVVDKATKLETIYDRIHEIRTRFEVVKRDAEIAYLKACLDGAEDRDRLRADLDARLAQLDDDFAFVASCNIGGEFMDPEKKARLRQIAKATWTRTMDDRIGLSRDETQRKNRTHPPVVPATEHLLADRDDHILPRDGADLAAESSRFGFQRDIPEHKYNLGEVYNLCIDRGTLTTEERFKINDHIAQTIIMLEQLPFPPQLRQVPEFAGGHHETMIGTGYPRRLTRDQMSVPARIMAIADIFEALTATDRPYKPAIRLSDSLRIMADMKNDQRIDPDLFRLFLTSGVYRMYAERFLDAEQVDTVDIAEFLDDT